MLVNVAKKCEDFLLCVAAIDMLTNQTSLTALAIAGGDQSGWRTSMNSADTIQKFGRDVFSDSVSNAAVDRLTDQGALAKVAATAKSASVREAASAKLFRP
jgi:hypothetical protein